jgi:hypothetical protein
MGILEEARSTLTLLDKVNAASQGVEEAQALDSLRNALSELSNSISLLASNASILRHEGISLSAIPDIGGVLDAVKNTRNRFIEIPKATTLRQGTRWTTLMSKLESLADQGREKQASDWRDYFEGNYFKGLPPDKRAATLAQTPDNKKAINNYRSLYQTFIKYRSQPPKNHEGFEDLQLLSKQLSEVGFQDDVPDDVRKFLDATSFGAGLDFVTIDVLNWLRDNNLLTNFIVRAK